MALVPINWQSNLNSTEQVLPAFSLFILQIHETPELSAFFPQLIIPSCIRHSHFTPFPQTFFMLGPPLLISDSTSSPLIFSYLSPLIHESLNPFSKIFFLSTPCLEIITPLFRLKSCTTAYHLLLCLHFSDYILEERVYSFLIDLHFWEH